MSCWAIEKCTIWNRCLSCFCGSENEAEKLSLTATVGNSSAPSVCSAKRLLPAWIVALRWFDRDADLGAFGQCLQDVDELARRQRWWRLRFAARAQRCGGLDLDLDVGGQERDQVRLPFAISTLARMGSVCLRSTMPATVESGLRIASRVGSYELHIVFIFLLVLLMRKRGIRGQLVSSQRGAALRAATSCGQARSRLCG
jgi:hypothetical protein